MGLPPVTPWPALREAPRWPPPLREEPPQPAGEQTGLLQGCFQGWRSITISSSSASADHAAAVVATCGVLIMRCSSGSGRSRARPHRAAAVRHDARAGMLLVGTCRRPVRCVRLCISVLSVPMLLDRDVDAFTAMGCRCDRLAELPVMLVGAHGSGADATGLHLHDRAGRDLPWLGHASWHAYTAMPLTDELCLPPRSSSRPWLRSTRPSDNEVRLPAVISPGHEASRVRREAVHCGGCVHASRRRYVPCERRHGAINLSTRRLAVHGATTRRPPVVPTLVDLGYEQNLFELAENDRDPRLRGLIVAWPWPPSVR